MSQTIAATPQDITRTPPSSAVTGLRNINKNMHAANIKYKWKCILCSRFDLHVVNHYVNEHTDAEVLISRPSPEMAKMLRSQSTSFRLEKKHLVHGICYFCGVNETFHKSFWLAHLRVHTGEKIFECSKCKQKLSRKVKHNKGCTLSNIESIFECDEQTNGFSVMGYMCKKCNYLQLAECNLELHITKEHNIHNTDTKQFYEKLFLVKDPSIVETCGE